MEARIEEVENGYVVTEYSDEESFKTSQYVYEKKLDAIRHIANMFDDTSRYDSNRIYVVEAPGDKNEGFTEEHAKVFWPED